MVHFKVYAFKNRFFLGNGMQSQEEKVEHKNFSSGDTRSFNNGQAEVMNIAGGNVGRLTLQPGWKWSNDVKPIAKTEWCEAPHFQYHVSGTLHVKMEDGTEFDLKQGDVSYLPSGHDAWVVGDEPVVVVDWHGASQYAK
jgi:mannose-6-phosphate isomerase-like protein (cupin superfamily)